MGALVSQLSFTRGTQQEMAAWRIVYERKLSDQGRIEQPLPLLLFRPQTTQKGGLTLRERHL